MRCLFWRGLSTERNLRFKIDWACLIVGSKFTVSALFYFVLLKAIFQVQAPGRAYIWRGDSTEGFLGYRFGGLIFGGAYFGILRYYILHNYVISQVMPQLPFRKLMPPFTLSDTKPVNPNTEIALLRLPRAV